MAASIRARNRSVGTCSVISRASADSTRVASSFAFVNATLHIGQELKCTVILSLISVESSWSR